VEDNEDIRFMLTTILGQAGYEAASVTTPLGALALAREGHFDLFILDAKLEAGSGLDLCRALRALRPEVPVIFYSGAAFDSDREAALAAGACAYVTKPGTEELLGAVRRVLSGEGGHAAEAEN
jgi:two-component system, OmpR family, response regulator